MLVSRPDHHTSIKESETVNVERGRGCSARDAQAHVETVPKPQSSLWMVLPAVPIPEACRAASEWCFRRCPFPKPAEQPLDAAPGGARSRSLQSSLWMMLPAVPTKQKHKGKQGGAPHPHSNHGLFVERTINGIHEGHGDKGVGISKNSLS